MDHAQVGPQPKGNILKGLCCQKRRPFLFVVIAIEFEANLSHFTHQSVGGLNTH